MTHEFGAYEHLRAGRQDLINQRDRLNEAIAALDALLASLGAEPQAAAAQGRGMGVTQRRSSVSGSSGPSRQTGPEESILKVMQERPDAVWSPTDVHEALQGAGINWKDSTTRSAVAKMAREGLLAKVRRGTYQLPATTEGANSPVGEKSAETPAATGVSDGPTPHEAEGGGSVETTRQASSPAEDQHHPQLGASIAEAQ